MAKGKNIRGLVQEERPEVSDAYWDNLTDGIRRHGSPAEQQALRAVVHGLAHAELHPTEKLAGQIGLGKNRRLPRRYREAAS